MDENNMDQGYYQQTGYQQPVQDYGQSQQGYQQGYNQPGYNNAPQGKQGNSPAFTTLILLAVLQTCCCNTVTGVIAIILTFLADNAYKSGDFAGYESKRKIVIIVLIAGVVLTILMSIFSLVCGIADISDVMDMIE